MAETNQTFNPAGLSFSDEDYKKAAKKWSLPLLQIPLLEVNDILQYTTGMGGVRYKVALPTVEGSAQFAPYNAFRKSADGTKVNFRELETFLGSVQQDFEPLQYVQLLIGQQSALLGDQLKQAPSAKLVLASVMKSLGYNLRQALFSARRKADGTTTMDLFNGWMTIVDDEIAAGNISADNGNYQQITEEATSANAVDIAKSIERTADPQLRQTAKFLFCSPEFADLYNDNYMLTHAAQVYNKQFEQVYLEGSGNRTTIVPLDVLAGSKKFILTPKSNMLYGFDNMSQLSTVEVNRFSSFVLTLAATMFFGTQFYTIDKRFFKVVEFKAAAAGGGKTNP